MAKDGVEDEETIEEPRSLLLKISFISYPHCSSRNGGGSNILIRYAGEIKLGGTEILRKRCKQMQREEQLGQDAIK